MLQEMWNAPPGFRPTKSAPSSPAKPLGISRTRSEAFHVAHKVPVGDSPYVRAKNVQLVDKDPERAIPLFWAAINAGDRVDSALKDMAIVMKQQNRAEEAVEAIKSLRSRCSDQAQEALDNILLDLYKRCGRLDDQIGLLRHKLFLIQQGMAFNGKRTKTARSQGKKFQVSVEQEATRLLGNLGWALMQQNNYIEAEDAYRRALLIAPDNNKMCNLGICLMKQGRIGEAKENLRKVKPAVMDGPRGVDSHLKAYERAQQMLRDLESEMMIKGGEDRVEQSKLFESFLGSSAIWQPQPCREQGGGGGSLLSSSSSLDSSNRRDEYANENINSSNVMMKSQKVVRPLLQLQKPLKPNVVPSSQVNFLNIDAPPFYSSKVVVSQDSHHQSETLKRTRSIDADAANSATFGDLKEWKMPTSEPENKVRKQSISPRKDAALLLPDSIDFEEAIINAVLSSSDAPRKLDKRLRVFQDITQNMSPSPSPRARA